MDITNLKQLEAELNKRIRKAMESDVAPIVKKVMSDNVHEEVYSKYEPRVYQRLGDQGGLSDPANMESKMLDDNTLSVENVRHDGDRNVAEIVETGMGYTYSFEYAGVPRPFTEATREELNNTNEHVYGLYKGLKKQGLNIEVK